ncbi:hypothetical protein B0T17DRAFT_539958 [Bombardia bombarda]|uniref:Uncharacterized protein n=1 Tax=Bombardia bombarda TaxID=252184 RepID=A0AA39WII1_9PEZI|nr:hypothetical protein B0T17DRAFT_539958 [Bombardia bombarda]
MTRRIVYSAALAAVVAATAMTIASVVSTNWITYSVTTKSGHTVYDNIGLHQRCTSAGTSASSSCVPFPSDDRCAKNGPICNIWRTTGFLMNLAVVLQCAVGVGIIISLAGGRVRRTDGWRILSVPLAIDALLQFCSVTFVQYLHDHDDMFIVPGYRLSWAWYLCIASACLTALVPVGMTISAYVLPDEDGYELLPDPAPV